MTGMTGGLAHAQESLTMGQAVVREASADVQVLLCSVSGDIFPVADSEQERAQLGLQQGPDLRQAYLGSLLGTVLPWVAPPEQALHTAAANSEAELLDACRWGVGMRGWCAMLGRPSCARISCEEGGPTDVGGPPACPGLRRRQLFVGKGCVFENVMARHACNEKCSAGAKRRC